MDSIQKNVKGGSRYFFFIALLRMLATCLITNTHLGSIYPQKFSFLAVGGLLGDALFFAVSGFCLAESVNSGFLKWYAKRIIRIYPTVIIITLVDCLFGEYKIHSFIELVRVFIYPTRFHFIASIMLLYIFFFFALKVTFLKNNLPLLMSALGVVWLAVYIFAFDKTVRLDTAEQPITKFLFFESMLFGAYVAKNKNTLINRKRAIYFVGLTISLFAYLASKIVIDRFAVLNFQIIIVLSLFFTCCFFLLAFSGVEGFISRHKVINKVTRFIAPLTLEIYVVQHLIILTVKNLKQIVFPLNFLLVIPLILFFAFLLNRGVKHLIESVRRIIRKPKKFC